jgi:hypothetical protein
VFHTVLIVLLHATQKMHVGSLGEQMKELPGYSRHRCVGVTPHSVLFLALGWAT